MTAERALAANGEVPDRENLLFSIQNSSLSLAQLILRIENSSEHAQHMKVISDFEN